MARTRGARDKSPRKRPERGAGGRFEKGSRTSERPVTALDDSQTNEINQPDSEFERAVADTLGQPKTLPGSPQVASSDPTQSSSDSPAASAGVFGLEAWAAIIQAPFRSAAIWFGIPAFEQLGQLRCKMLAEPSYPLYVHYVEKYLTDNPNDELFVAKMMTGAAVVTVLQEAWLILKLESAKRQAAQSIAPNVPLAAVKEGSAK